MEDLFTKHQKVGSLLYKWNKMRFTQRKKGTKTEPLIRGQGARNFYIYESVFWFKEHENKGIPFLEKVADQVVKSGFY